MKSYRDLYSRFLQAHSGVQHFASHSHHYWPDVTFEAHQQYWLDSCAYVDDKWDYFFSKKVPQAQRLIADILNLSKPEQIVFAPNTHELCYRIFSCFPVNKKIRILTTDSEFYSFERQVVRFEESAGRVEVVRVATLPFHSFEERFAEEIQKHCFDLIFVSQVFFNSGIAIKGLATLISQIQNPDTLMVIDGYHGFMAVPTDLRGLENRIFYLAGSYKYAQGGEGCCFMASPAGNSFRPEYTGWFAGFDSLANFDKQVQYSDDGYRFAGSTMDFSALYRLIAALEKFKQEGLTVDLIHCYIQDLQKKFIQEVDGQDHMTVHSKNLLKKDLSYHGHFLTFQTESPEECSRITLALRKNKIWTDYRGNRLRFGFGLYHDSNYDLSALKKI